MKEAPEINDIFYGTLNLNTEEIAFLTAGQVRSSVGTYAGAARRRVHLATIHPRLPSAHRPGRRQARHARILQIGLHLTQP